MPSYSVIDLHCDTLTAFQSPLRCRDTLNDPCSDFALCKIPANTRWGQCCAVFVPDGLTPEEALGYYRFHRRSFQRQGEQFAALAQVCTTAGQMEAAWAQKKAALLLTVENGSLLGTGLDKVEELRRDGVCLLTLTWNGENALGSGNETDHGLTSLGKAAVPALEEAGILLDVSHLNDAGFRDVLEVAQKPFVASHSNARALCPHRRNLTDSQAQEITRRGGLVGLNYYSPFLRSDGRPAEFEDVYRHAAHFLELGLEHCLALGSDFDGADLPDYLNPGDCLILNNSRVLPARLVGQRLPGGGICEVLLLNDRGDKVWECLVRPGRKLRKGTRLSFGNGELTAEIVEQLEEGGRLIRFDYEGIFLETLERLGKMPLPPYIKEELQDQERYQTVYSKVLGSAAAPTAGLHFTPELLEKIRAKGVKIGYVTLHVGLGTFRPVKEDTIEDHPMHSEYCTIPQETADLINETRANGGRCICVGTTSCRTLESWAAEDGHMEAKSGWTDIYIYPGYRFKVMDGLVTNFHLPESTLIMLVSAFAGREHVLAAYEEAVREKYRFFSFGDAMFIS